MGTVLRRRQRVLSALGTLAFLAASAAPSARAEDAPSDPLPLYLPAPSMIAPPTRLDDVEAAIGALKRACAAWPPATPLPEPDSYRPYSSPVVAMRPPDPQPTRDVCTAISDPERMVLQLALFGGALGAVLTIGGLIGFCWLRGVLAGLWAGRPAHGSRRNA